MLVVNLRFDLKEKGLKDNSKLMQDKVGCMFSLSERRNSLK